MFAQGASSRLTVARETSIGVLPSSPSFTTLPVRGHTLNLTKERLEGNDIIGGRMPYVDRHGNRAVGGSLEVDLRRGDYDVLFESVFFNTFDTNDHIISGVTPQFLAFEDAATDISQFRQFSGCLVSQVAINIAPNQMVQATFDIVGKDMAMAQTALDASPADPSGYEPFDSYNGEILEGGVATANGICNVSAISFSLTNDITPAFVILCAGSRDTPAQMQYGMQRVEGTMSVYYEDETFIDKFLNETETELSITVDDPTGANAYTFYMPRVKYNGANVPVADRTARIIELPFVALKDLSAGYHLRLTRTSGT